MLKAGENRISLESEFFLWDYKNLVIYKNLKYSQNILNFQQSWYTAKKNAFYLIRRHVSSTYNANTY